ncbi:MAG: hypothetical protein J6K32_01845 [Clostridia bacterium]|nr:hypothetical protein [Clostridia bacterium]
MAYGAPYGYPMYGGYMPQMQQPMPDQLAQLRGAQPYPQMQQGPQQSAQTGGLLWVQGEAGARGYLVAPGQTVMLLDSERASFYLKSSDASGVPSMRIFDYTERTAQAAPAQEAAQYATREEVEELKTQLAAMTQRMQRMSRRGKEEEQNEQPAV